MTESIKDFTDEDLLQVFQINATQLSIARRKPNVYGEKLPEFIHDQREIEKEIDSRMTVDYMWEIEQIRQGQTAPATDIHPGNRYRHKVLRMLRLQVVDEYDFNGPLWSVRVFIGKAYACRFIVKTCTILEHFNKDEEI